MVGDIILGLFVLGVYKKADQAIHGQQDSVQHPAIGSVSVSASRFLLCFSFLDIFQ